MKDIGHGDNREMGRWPNTRAAHAHPPVHCRAREAASGASGRSSSLPSEHTSLYDHFPTERHLQLRDHGK